MVYTMKQLKIQLVNKQIQDLIFLTFKKSDSDNTHLKLSKGEILFSALSYVFSVNYDVQGSWKGSPRDLYSAKILAPLLD